MAGIGIAIISKPTGTAFARHESFHPRYGWLKKGFDKALEDASVFLREDAAVTLGVGKNMVRSIRYWCNAFKVLEEHRDPKNRFASPTLFGSELLSNNGWDPYLEDSASLWLLHWHLLKSPNLATTWHFVFNQFRFAEFSPDEIFSGLNEYIQKTHSGLTVADSSLKGDIACLIRMYSANSVAVRMTEENIASPFVALGLIEQLGSEKIYSFRVGHKPNLPPEVVAFTCLQYAQETRPGSRSINLSHLLFNEGSPGLCFRLTESAMCTALELVSNKYQQISLSDTAGILQLQFQSEPHALSSKLLSDYYSVNRRSI